MKRNEFLQKGLASGAFLGTTVLTSGLGSESRDQEQATTINTQQKSTGGDILKSASGPEEIVIERPFPGKPHKGKVLLAIQPHSDDITLYAAGTVAKLMDEGYTGYLLRTTDDSSGDYEGNRKDNEEIARFFGMEKAYDFMYKHHQMDAIQIQDLKGRLIFLFRLLKVDTLICYDPWEHYDENPDHIATAHAVEAARWMAGMRTDYPEHLDAGLRPYSPKEVYYYSRDARRANRIVDITNYMDKKVEVNMLNITKGPAGIGKGKALKDRLAKEGKKLAILGDDDSKADFNYIKNIVFDIQAKDPNFYSVSTRELGEQYGLGWAERFRYISYREDLTDSYVRANAIPL
jgi:LmbE family N-acetylglucosaminyl deacetylase